MSVRLCAPSVWRACASVRAFLCERSGERSACEEYRYKSLAICSPARSPCYMSPTPKKGNKESEAASLAAPVPKNVAKTSERNQKTRSRICWFRT